MGVDRCVCHRVTFRQLHELSRIVGQDFERLREATGCGSTCGMCVPYIKVAMKTGRVRVPVMSDGELASVLGSESQKQSA
jgi:bacterioferritin-associated ferredoxin